MDITQSIVSQRDRALLGGDYAGYRAQATRRVQALRKRLGVATPRGRKYTPKSPVTAENVSQNAEWIQLLLASSERAWADAMAMKSMQSPGNTQRSMPGSTKKQIASRHRRAIAYATNIVDALLDSVSQASQVDVLEAKAYLALLKGGLNFEKGHWSSCIQNYAMTRLIYTALDTKTKSDIYKDLLSSTIDPSIRYAAYQSKLPRTKAVNDIAIENFPAMEEGLKEDIRKVDSQAFIAVADKVVSVQKDGPTNLPPDITWRSRRVKIEDASISQALGASTDKEATLSKTYSAFVEGNVSAKDLAAAYEDVIDARQEAVDTTKTAIDELRSEGIDQSDPRIQSLQITRTAVNYAVIEWRIGRNRVLCGKDDGLSFSSESQEQNAKPRRDDKVRTVKEDSTGRKVARLRERTALYDSILQSLDVVKELPGVAADSVFTEELDGKKAYFRALKCLAIGRSHRLHGNLVNALALFSRASEHIQQANLFLKSAATSSGTLTKLDISADQLSASQKYLASLTLQYRALVDLEQHQGSNMPKEKKFVPPLIERFHLNQYDENADLSNLVNYPLKLQPVPVKPLFFDLAWNYIHYPGQPQPLKEPAVQTPQEAKKEEKSVKKGWFGFGGR